MMSCTLCLKYPDRATDTHAHTHTAPGENWAHYFNWTNAEWRRIGFASEEHKLAERRQLQRGDSKFGMQAARKRWGPENERDIVAPLQAF